MSRFSVIVLSIFFLLQTACLDAPRDNIYDPDNPNKAHVSVNAYELGIYPRAGAVVYLMQDDVIIQSDTTDADGLAAFDEIDPGIYYLMAMTDHYRSVEQGPESLWAGTHVDNYPLEFLTRHFEDDSLGCSSPHRFVAHSGQWAVVEDIEEPHAHSTPHVYQGSDSSASGYALTLCEPDAPYFLLDTKLKVVASSENNWNAGVVFRFRDENNYYMLTLSTDTTYCYYVLNGQPSFLRITERTSAVDTWHTIKVEHRVGDPTIRLNIDNALAFVVYDSIFSGGQLGLVVSNSSGPTPAITYFDDVTIDLSYTHVQ